MPLYAIDNERELLLRVAEGSEKSFANLFYAYHNQLGEFVQILTGSKEQTQEIIQDVFVKVWTERTSLPNLQNFISWLFILTRNYTLNSLRKQSAEKKHLSVVPLPECFENTCIDDRTVEKDLNELLDIAVSRLPPQQQRAYKLSREEGFDNNYIGRQLGVSPDSVKKYLQWAQQSIMRFLRSHAGLLLIISFGTRF